jgi:hypothetical protein
MNPAKEVFLTIAKQVAQQLAIINSAKVVTA